MPVRVLYPHLAGKKSQFVRKTALEFVHELGGIGDAFLSYRRKWSSAEEITANHPAFATETRALIAALGERIEREETIRFDLIDSA